MGDVFCSIGVYDKQKSASVAFTNFGAAHKYNIIILSHSLMNCNYSSFRQMADEGDKLVKRAAPVGKID